MYYAASASSPGGGRARFKDAASRVRAPVIPIHDDGPNPVIASEAKQSIAQRKERMNCFVAGKAGRLAHPQAPCETKKHRGRSHRPGDGFTRLQPLR
jgi:hypothetical protein